MRPMVSVILPVYNQSQWLPTSIRSVLRQTLTNFELIILNDGSTEDIAAVVKQFRDPRIRYYPLPHQGLVTTLNKGLRLAKGKYITWHSADNLMEANLLKELVTVLETRAKYGSAYADYQQIDSQGRAIRTLSKGKPDGKKNFGPAFLYRATVCKKVGFFDKSMELVEDRDYSIRMAKAAPVYWLPKMLYSYRVHRDSLTGRIHQGKAGRRFREAYRRLLAKHPHIK